MASVFLPGHRRRRLGRIDRLQLSVTRSGMPGCRVIVQGGWVNVRFLTLVLLNGLAENRPESPFGWRPNHAVEAC